jgi:hypothetical protein
MSSLRICSQGRRTPSRSQAAASLACNLFDEMPRPYRCPSLLFLTSRTASLRRAGHVLLLRPSVRHTARHLSALACCRNAAELAVTPRLAHACPQALHVLEPKPKSFFRVKLHLHIPYLLAFFRVTALQFTLYLDQIQSTMLRLHTRS